MLAVFSMELTCTDLNGHEEKVNGELTELSGRSPGKGEQVTSGDEEHCAGSQESKQFPPLCRPARGPQGTTVVLS